ncbi:MAG: hypothetical protein ACRC30_08335 [Clostridium sp.]
MNKNNYYEKLTAKDLEKIKNDDLAYMLYFLYKDKRKVKKD